MQKLYMLLWLYQQTGQSAKFNKATIRSDQDRKTLAGLDADGLVSISKKMLDCQITAAGVDLIEKYQASFPRPVHEFDILDEIIGKTGKQRKQIKTLPARDRDEALAEMKRLGFLKKDAGKTVGADLFTTTTAGRALLEVKPSSPVEQAQMEVLLFLKSKGSQKRQSVTSTFAKRFGGMVKTQKTLVSMMDSGLVTGKSAIQRAGARVVLNDRGRGIIEAIEKQFNTMLNSQDTTMSNVDQMKQEIQSDDDLLNLIKATENKLNTDSFLPIFEIRARTMMAREDLDAALYRLEKAKKISMASLDEPEDYTEEQLASGIKRPIGQLFYIQIV